MEYNQISSNIYDIFTRKRYKDISDPIKRFLEESIVQLFHLASGEHSHKNNHLSSRLVSVHFSKKKKKNTKIKMKKSC